MQTRMEKYHDNYEPVSRTKLNQNIYDNLYRETEYSSVEGVAEIPNTREIDIQKIREMLKDKTYKAPVIEAIPKEEPVEEKNYDLNDIIIKAKDNVQEQDKHHSLSLTQVDLLKKPTKEETNLESLISSISNTSLINKKGESETEYDLFSDLKSENTVVDKSVKDYINEAKKEMDNTGEIDRSFFTQSLGLTSEDFEELKDINKSLKKNNILVKILLFLMFVIFITTAMFLIYNLFR